MIPGTSLRNSHCFRQGGGSTGRRIRRYSAGQLRRSYWRRRRRWLPQRSCPTVRTSTTGARHPQTRVCARPSSRAHILRPQASSSPSSTPTETLQDRLHQGANPTTSNHPWYPSHCSSCRAEDAYLCSCEETRWSSTNQYPHPSTHPTIQTGSILHPLQDTGKLGVNYRLSRLLETTMNLVHRLLQTTINLVSRFLQTTMNLVGRLVQTTTTYPFTNFSQKSSICLV